ncbi:MAG: tyrosine-type recombinase/integrase [Bacilli bacterium]|nr:tyrosine-type recombinase/integrase [Bacilli bacterium]
MTKTELIEIETRCLAFLTNEQIGKLDSVLKSHLIDSESDLSKEADQRDNESLLSSFLSAKKVEGCSERSLSYYKFLLDKALECIGKAIIKIETDDIRSYLNSYAETHSVSKTSVDNIRRVMSSFFSWLEEEDHIMKSPMRRIHKIKAEKTIKAAFSDDEVEKIKEACRSRRDDAIIALLLSTGMRVGEMARLKLSDISLDKMECVVFGKGAKERIVYFDSATKLRIERYIEERRSDSEFLFVSKDKRHSRLQVSGIESIVRKIGLRSEVTKCHPHRFRRTLATKAIQKGIPVEQVQVILGHTKIETTLRYAIVEQSNVRNSYRRLF